MSSNAKPDNPAPGEDVFTEEDIVPGADELRETQRGTLKHRLDRAAAIIAVLAYGMVVGGMIALGACAAPMVFKLTPYPFSGQAMGAAFSRFDYISMGAAVVGLAAEMLRTCLSLRTPNVRAVWPRVRRYAAIFFAAAAVYIGTQLSPQIMAAHNMGVRRNVGAEGVELERVHKQAELIAKILVALGVGLVALHVTTLPGAGPRPEDEEVLAPLPPGPTPR